MAPLQVVGAGLGRTGTLSLKTALEQLTGGRCYHMLETFEQPEHVRMWQSAIDGKLPDWDVLFADYVAAVDWPACAFWRELSDAYPDAHVLLSTRPTAAWWKSANDTIFQVNKRENSEDPFWAAHQQMVKDLLHQFTPTWAEEAGATAAYDAHNAEVRANVPAERLTEWSPGDGWGPLCKMLGVDEPDMPFPHVNTTDDFRAMVGLDKE